MAYRNYYYPWMYKRAAQPPMMDPAMMGGAPPMDPAMMGGAPPMDPAMMGGAPPMDPAMMGAAPPPPMDPAMMGAPPVDPAAAGLPPTAPPPPEEAAVEEPAKKNKKQQLEDDIAEIKNAVYNQQVMTALIIKALKVPIPAEALITPTAANMDISNPTPDIKDFGEAPAGDEPAPPTGGDMPKQGSFASLITRDTTKLASLLNPPKGLAGEFGF